MSHFNWNSIDESPFQGQLNKYTNAFKGFQTRYFVLDAQAKSLHYFMVDELRKKGPRGAIDLTDCWVSPSNEDDITFTVQTGAGEIFKLRANNAKGRQRWIDKLRACSGIDTYVSTLPIPKIPPITTLSSSLGHSPNESHIRSSNRRDSKVNHHQQTINDLKEVMRCVEVNQRDFIETIDTIPDSVTLHSLSKDMLLLRSISQSCVNSLHDSLTILTRRRTPDHEPIHVTVSSSPSPQSSTGTINNSHKQLNQSLNSEKSSLTIGLSSQSTLFNSQNKTSSCNSLTHPNETCSSTKHSRTNDNSPNRLSESTE